MLGNIAKIRLRFNKAPFSADLSTYFVVLYLRSLMKSSNYFVCKLWIIRNFSLLSEKNYGHYLILCNNYLLTTGCNILKWTKLNGSGGKKINNFGEFWCLVDSADLDIWVSSTSFQKSNIGCKQNLIKVGNSVLKFIEFKK